jgi:hypothetical protein
LAKTLPQTAVRFVFNRATARMKRKTETEDEKGTPLAQIGACRKP